MKKTFVAALALLLSAGAAPAVAQQGFALKLAPVFNFSTVEQRETDLRLKDAVGWSIGAEYVLPGGFGLGVSGYTAVTEQGTEASRTSFVTLAEANYFFGIPLLPVSPYAGLHTGLGVYGQDEVRDRVRPEVDFGDIGFQIGVRFQPISLLGVDAQYRRVSGSLRGEQGGGFTTNQVLLGVTLF